MLARVSTLSQQNQKLMTGRACGRVISKCAGSSRRPWAGNFVLDMPPLIRWDCFGKASRIPTRLGVPGGWMVQWESEWALIRRAAEDAVIKMWWALAYLETRDVDSVKSRGTFERTSNLAIWMLFCGFASSKSIDITYKDRVASFNEDSQIKVLIPFDLRVCWTSTSFYILWLQGS